MHQNLQAAIDTAFGKDSENAKKATALLTELGAESLDDAKHVTEAELTGAGIPKIPARKFLAAVNATPSGHAAPAPANNGEPQRIIIAHERTLEDLSRLELLQRLAAGDRTDALWDALHHKGVNVILTREDGGILAEETDQAMAEKIRLQEGVPFGRHHRIGVTLASLFEKKRQIDPFDGSTLVDGFNNATQADWKEVPREAQAFVAYVFHFMDPASPKPTSDVLTVLEHLEGCENNAQKLGQHKRWKLAATIFAQAAKEDPGLLKRIEDFLNGKVKSPKASPPPVPAQEMAGPQRTLEPHTALGNAQVPAPIAHRNFTPDEMRNIRSVFCRLIQDQGDIAIVLQDSGVNLSRIDRSGAAESFWHSGLEEAKKSGVVHRVLNEVRRRYPHSPDLNELMRNIDIR